ncbi:MAG: heliorhodopsin HeR [Candidatus Bathyarchaeota archaeon]|nr:MAG: heliorhodopsin HeR [Candidatus Bathyarchaeota archaeon]
MDNPERLKIIASSPISFGYLKRFNAIAGVLHLAQGIIMLALGLLLDWSRDIYTFYLDIDILSTEPFLFEVVPNPQILFTVSFLGAILASFPLISAIAHFSIAYLKNAHYIENLKKGINPYRWFEYVFSSSIMIVLIATFVGVWELWSLVMIFVLNAMMIMFGYLMELLNQYSKKTTWSPYILGCISGGVPWIALFAYFIAAIGSTGTNPPTFVYLILFVYFILFNSFALNMILQYRGVGKWRDYLYGERAYIILSFVAKTLLAWLTFVGVFAPF